MTILAISTASPALSLSLFDGEAVVAHDHRVIGRGHAEALMPAIAALLGATVPDAIIVDLGPGSFTGIRVGLAAARALGLAWDIPVSGCSGAALVAAQAFARAPGLACLTVVLDAGRGQILGQTFAADFTAGPIATLAALPHDGGASAGPLAPASAIHRDHPDARFVLQLPAAARGLPPAALYVRPPDAVLPL